MNHSSLSTSAAPRPSTTVSLLNRILETPDLVTHIQNLPAHSLLTLVNKVGLEDSCELLALATTAQLTRMVDEDLWKQSSSNQKEEFNPDRLSVWLRTLEEMGSKLAAEKLSEMDEDFLAYAFGHYLHCLELEALQFMLVNVQGDSWQDSRLESVLESHNTQELGEYLVLAKATAPWDTLQSLLLSLDEVDTSLCRRLLMRLCAATEEKSEKEGGLFEVLSGEEMLESDASFSRHQRRTGDGFVPAEDALAFMDWAKATPVEKLLELKGRDPVSRSYFREYKGEVLEQAVRSECNALHKLLGDEEVPDSRQRAPLLEGKTASAWIQSLAKLGPEEKERFLLDLNFLTQCVLLTEKTDEPLRQKEAAELVIQCCEAGHKLLPTHSPLNAIQLFCLGRKTRK